MSKHTPGPWEVDYETEYLTAPSRVWINAECLQHVALIDGMPSATKDANARLIAAAPDLLAVAQELAASAEYWSEYDVPIGIVDRLRSAIAKATGGQHD